MEIPNPTNGTAFAKNLAPVYVVCYNAIFDLSLITSLVIY